MSAVAIRTRCSHDQVSKSVAIDVPRRTHRAASIVARRATAQFEAGNAVERRDAQIRPEPARFAKHHVACPRVIAARISTGGTDDQVAKAVTIDIARCADRLAEEVAPGDATDLETVDT